MRSASAPWRRGVADSLRRGWLAFLPFAFVPIAGWAGSLPHTPTGVVVVLALAAWAAVVLTQPPGAVGAALLARADDRPRIGAWELSLLAFVLTACVAYLVTGVGMAGITYNDGAYYYGVARHMAATGRFEEPIVWHFLHPPDQIVHTPFDYWGSVTSLLLVPSLALFGATPTTANVTMSVVSGLALLAFWYLVCRAMPLRYYATQLLAVVVFALSPSLDVYRFQPESITVMHVFLLLALIAFATRRFVAAILCGFGMLLTRSDGLILLALLFAAVLVEQRRSAAPRSAVWRSVLVGLGCAATYVVWSLVSFGTSTPPGPSAVPFLPNYWHVFNYFGSAERVWIPFWERLTSTYMHNQMGRALRTLHTVPFAPAMYCWLALALLPVFGGYRRRPPVATLIWLMCFVGYFGLAWVSGPGFAPVRTPYVFTPLVVLAGALGVDELLHWLQRWMEHGVQRRVRAAVSGALVLGMCTFFLGALPVLRGWNKVSNLPRQSDFFKLDEVLHGEPVASNAAWYMISHTRSPTVSIPFNGGGAVEAVLSRYHIRWLVIVGRHGGNSRAWISGILDGTRTEVGRFRFERVPIDGVKAAAVFRVLDASSDPERTAH